MSEEQRILDARDSRELVSHAIGCAVYPGVFIGAGFLGALVGGESGASIGLFIGVITSVIIACLIAATNEKHRERMRQKRQSNKQYIENELKRIEQDGFAVSRIVKDVGSDYALAIDTEGKQWIIIDPMVSSTSQYEFSDLITYDVVQDGESLMSGNSGAAFIGGMAFGTVGAIAGAAGERTITTNCTELYINISVNDIHVPRKKLTFISSPLSKDTEEYKYEVSFMQEVAALLDYIKANSQNETTTEEPVKDVPADKYQEIEKLHELKKQGIISEEEFAQKKKELLGL